MSDVRVPEGRPMVLVVAGAPGTGKSTLCAALQAELGSGVPYVEFSSFREPHLLRDWSNQSPDEEQLAWENLSFAIRNYVKHGFTPVLVTDLKDERVAVAALELADLGVLVITLTADPEVVDARVRARADGFTNAQVAVAWNEAVRAREPLTHEIKVDATEATVTDLLLQVTQLLEKPLWPAPTEALP